MVETLRFTRRNLPHWVVADRTYFVTIRLQGTLPRAVVAEMQAELDTLRARDASDEDLLEAQRRQFMKIERILDACTSDALWLRDPEVAGMVLSNLAWFDAPDQGWDILAAVAMANHVHLLMRNDAGRTGCLMDDLARFKRYTARRANAILGRKGTFWAREDFDHWCRTPDKVEAAVAYIKQNPVKAMLCARWEDWPWTQVKETWQK